MAGLRRWWIKKYQLPPHHPLFLQRSVAEHLQEIEEDLLLLRDDLESELEESPQSERGDINKRLVRVRQALGEKEASTDPLVDKWERELADGKVPDLYEEL
jgi:hypothetical protein